MFSLGIRQYGKDLDWKKEHYTAHDVASVFRRFLTQMPVRRTAPLMRIDVFTMLQEPVIPHDMYHHVSDNLYRHDLTPLTSIDSFEKPKVCR